MSVYDKPNDVARTIDSILSQKDVIIELVIVNDGANDSVVSTLETFRDQRIRLINQDNQGLTAALIAGCAAASHEFIARVDAGDQMLPDRLKQQAVCLYENKNVAVVSCWVHVHTDEGHHLYDVNDSSDDLMTGLRTLIPGRLKSPVHSSVMFRKSAYERVGGYRREFYFTQDCDLWARLLSFYDLIVVPKVLQRALFSASGISGRNAATQKRLADLIVNGNALRANGEPDEVILPLVSKQRPMADSVSTASDFAGNYFIASVLSKSQPKASLMYWRRSLVEKPMRIWVWARYFKSLVNSIYR